jgi:hypothetical protein
MHNVKTKKDFLNLDFIYLSNKITIEAFLRIPFTSTITNRFYSFLFSVSFNGVSNSAYSKSIDLMVNEASSFNSQFNQVLNILYIIKNA